MDCICVLYTVRPFVCPNLPLCWCRLGWQVLKDHDALRYINASNGTPLINIPQDACATLLNTLQRDVTFLAKHDIMDYSLLIGIGNKSEGESTFHSIAPEINGGDKLGGCRHTPLMNISNAEAAASAVKDRNRRRKWSLRAFLSSNSTGHHQYRYYLRLTMCMCWEYWSVHGYIRLCVNLCLVNLAVASYPFRQ